MPNFYNLNNMYFLFLLKFYSNRTKFSSKEEHNKYYLLNILLIYEILLINSLINIEFISFYKEMADNNYSLTISHDLNDFLIILAYNIFTYNY